MPQPRHLRPAGFTLVEVMMASLILVAGFIGMIEAVGLGSNMMDSARRQTLAAQILNHEIEKLRLSSWTTISAMTATSPTPTIDGQFSTAITASGATYTLTRTVADPTTNLREITYTVTWVVKTSRLKADGTLLTFTYTRTNSAYYGKYGLNLTYQRS
ncbi:MAG TPA: prepilin-type N-terminal cleavage/methylation domain-containing protein [Lacunisphaera sp.]|nr:prepilin-type N-terminal cleavage/methylation domain-containing protein [Lacunisphaera sp.]